MQTRDFHFDLPPELIAQQPAANRTDSRLLVVDRAEERITDHHFSDLLDFVKPEDCLIFNDTRVIPARLFGHKATGGKIEILIERVLDAHHALAHIRASKSPKVDSQIHVTASEHQDYTLTVTGREGEFFQLSSDEVALSEIMQNCGHMPLPPYIDRPDETTDQERYQTVYAATPGAVAAPTAGLHFDDALLESLAVKGISSSYVTLHVGAGTFQPVRVEHIEDHRMHSEYLEVSQQTVDACRQARARGGRIIAVGTTSVRCLETASQSGRLETFKGDTDIFIYPGYTFKSVDAMITNFHLPESTLLMLVSAFSGRDNIQHAYAHAIEQRYRFFSYGDAMLLL